MKLKHFTQVAGIISALIFLAVGSLTYISSYRITDIDESLSPHGEYTLLFQSVGEPDFPFGYSHVRLVLKNGRSTLIEHRFDLANDGKWTCSGDWKVKWGIDRVTVTVSGEEQEDVTYLLFFSGRVETE